MPQQFQGAQFPSIPALFDHVKSSVSAMPLRSDLTGADLDLVQELWSRVNEGEPPARFWVVPHAGNREIRFRDANGDARALSIKKAVGREAHSGPDAMKVLRTAVSKQIERWKASQFAAGPVYCALSGAELQESETDVDHCGNRVFADLAREWLESIGGFENVELKNEPLIGYSFKDFAQWQSWTHFHAANMELRPLRRDVHQFRTKVQQRARVV